jgi:HEAT repeat protein
MSHSKFIRSWLLLVLSACGSASIVRAEIRPDYLMDHDPEIHVAPPVKEFSPKLRQLWLAALARPEADMQRMSADAIARGRRAGIPDLESAAPRLAELLADEKSQPVVQIAAARALIALAAKQTAPEMAAAARKFGADLRQTAEPALAEWRYDPFIADWEARLTAPATRHRDLILAIRCLAVIGREPAADRLLEIVHDPLPRTDVRIEAARAAGRLRDRGLERDVRKLMAGAAPSKFNRLCAVELLTRHAGEEAQSLLLKFAVDEEPAVAVVALARLIEIDPHLILPVAEHAMQSVDARVREQGAEAYVLLPDPHRISVLAKLLDDPHPALRRSICSSLLELASRPELDGPIREAAVQMLASNGWRGEEQAALLLGTLDHEPSAPRFEELLDSPRAEVEIAAAWALKSLAIPEMLPDLLDRTQRRTDQRSQSGPQPPALDEEVGHLFELFGKLQYAAAEPLLKQYVPKRQEMGAYSRSAAIWTLGHLHAGVPDEKLASQFLARAIDRGPPAEVYKVQIMSLVSIGRMKAVSQTEAIRQIYGLVVTSSYDAEIQRWVLMQLTGAPLPELISPIVSPGDWFLTPLDP